MKFGLMGRLSRILRGAVTAQVPHDMGAQVPAAPAPTLGVLARQLRLKAGLTRAELARQAGITENTVRAVEHGMPASPETLAALRVVPALGEVNTYIPHEDPRPGKEVP